MSCEELKTISIVMITLGLIAVIAGVSVAVYVMIDNGKKI